MKERKVATLEKTDDHYTGRFAYTGEDRNYIGEVGEVVKKVNPVFSTNISPERFEEEKLKGPYLFLMMQMKLPEGVRREFPNELGTRMYIPEKYLEKVVEELQRKEWEVRQE